MRNYEEARYGNSAMEMLYGEPVLLLKCSIKDFMGLYLGVLWKEL